MPIQKGVEIITGLQTSQETVDAAIAFCKAIGKIPSQSADSPGFLANRILMPYINEAIVCLETGVGGRDDIDAIMKNGTNVPMGPLQLADFIGIDTCLAIMKVLYEETGDSKYRPSVLLRKMVDAGWLGKKSGKGQVQLRANLRRSTANTATDSTIIRNLLLPEYIPQEFMSLPNLFIPSFRYISHYHAPHVWLINLESRASLKTS